MTVTCNFPLPIYELDHSLL